MIHLANLPNTGHDFSIATGDRTWRDLRPYALIPVSVALVAFAAVAVIAASSIRDAAAAVPISTPARERITDDVLLALALALPVTGAIAATILTSLSGNGAHAPAAEQSSDPCCSRRLKQPASAGASGTQLEEGIECLTVHAVSPSLAQPTITLSLTFSARTAKPRFSGPAPFSGPVVFLITPAKGQIRGISVGCQPPESHGTGRHSDRSWQCPLRRNKGSRAAQRKRWNALLPLDLGAPYREFRVTDCAGVRLCCVTT
jgi:hypothetical protein